MTVTIVIIDKATMIGAIAIFLNISCKYSDFLSATDLTEGNSDCLFCHGVIICHNVSYPLEAWELHFGLCRASHDAERDADSSVVQGDCGAGVMNNQE